MRTVRRLRLVVVGLTAAAGALGVLVILTPAPGTLLARRPTVAVELVDRHGGLLRIDPDPTGVRFFPCLPDRTSPNLVAAVLAAEDRRFYGHPGVDPLALARAAWQDLRAGRVVSGGSTLTMQLARLHDPRPRTLAGKLAQIALATRLELGLSKERILAEYLSRAPMGNRIVGFEAAARVYLGKPSRQLSPAEAALLAAVPRSPSRSNPWRDEERLRARRDALLWRLRATGDLDDAGLVAALAEPVVLAEEPYRFPAPHFLARALRESQAARSGGERVVTTLEPELQRRVERIARWHRDGLATQGVSQIAVVVLDVARGEWLAVEGSAGFWDLPGGQLDGSSIPRQPGSALKPFTYAAGFDRTFTPATVLPDLPHAYTWKSGTWVPRNYDDRFHGPLRARTALACSVNVPAALLLAEIGPDTLLATLRDAGLTTLARAPEYYGLGLTMGAGEVRLDELANAFAALLRGGEWRAAASWRAVTDGAGRVLARPAPQASRQVISRESAAQVVDILADPEARAAAFGPWSVLRLPFPAAVKTGTSEGFRDNWCVGGTREVVVGVWCGSFDRAPMGNVSGVSGAGAVWRDVMVAWAELAHLGATLTEEEALGPLPAGLERVAVCALSGLAPGQACPATARELLRQGDPDLPRCDWHVRGGDSRVAVHWPALYRAWAGDGGSAPGPAPTTATLDPTARAPLAILTPASGDGFMLTPDLPRRFQTLELRCAARDQPPRVTWLVDGQPFATVSAPYSASWPLVGGVHRIAVADGDTASTPVIVSVLDATPREAVLP
jgi:penicillin-binding protein 1C